MRRRHRESVGSELKARGCSLAPFRYSSPGRSVDRLSRLRDCFVRSYSTASLATRALDTQRLIEPRQTAAGRRALRKAAGRPIPPVRPREGRDLLEQHSELRQDVLVAFDLIRCSHMGDARSAVEP